ncbi:MAG: HDOD domain-containing protein [Azoarcus sp.]|jgi:HD-like signal output (HDOD) protein|nr:HDOD domain-containing protein [Azoarcus sp.]
MQDFEAQTRALAAQIEQELEEGHLNFPTSMEISLRIKQLADDPNSSVDDIVAVVCAEPVLSAKVIRMANTMLLNPYGARITSVNNAVKRIGLAALRCLAFAVAAEQLSQDRRPPHLRKIATDLWRHLADIASWAYAFAHHLRAVNPDTAMLTGMMVDIGQFFLLARVADYPALESNIDRFFEFMDVWKAPISRSVLEAFELPNDIVDALDNETFREDGWPPQTLHDIVQAAIQASNVPNPTERRKPSRQKDGSNTGFDQQQLATLLDETRAGKDAILNAIYG